MRLAPHRKSSGFSLVEMAIVLAIVGLLLGGLLPTISNQIEQQRRNETRKQLDEIMGVLQGFAIINGYLPCPATTVDPVNVSYGLADSACSGTPAAEGYLPWKTLGVTETDAWGSKRSSAGNPWIGYWRYRVDRNFANSGVPITLSTGFSADALKIRDNNGNDLTSTVERPIAVVFSTGPNLLPNGQNSSFEDTGGTYQSDVPRADDKSTIGINEEFDDILIWISRPQLFNRMVAAGKLP